MKLVRPWGWGWVWVDEIGCGCRVRERGEKEEECEEREGDGIGCGSHGYHLSVSLLVVNQDSRLTGLRRARELWFVVGNFVERGDFILSVVHSIYRFLPLKPFLIFLR